MTSSTLNDKLYADFSPTRRPRQIHIGDHLVLYAAGGRKRVFAIAKVTSEVKASDDNEWPHRVDIEYLVRVSPPDGVHIDEVSPPQRDLLRTLRRQSYLRLSPEEYERAGPLKTGRPSLFHDAAERRTKDSRLNPRRLLLRKSEVLLLRKNIHYSTEKPALLRKNVHCALTGRPLLDFLCERILLPA
jgi:hypothetical protein